MVMRTTLQCAESVIILSDLDQEVAGYKVHDVLAAIPKSDMEGNTDFDFYWRLKEVQKYGQIEKMLENYHDPRKSGDVAGWTMDKYKQLHNLDKLYAEYPDKDWYMIINADTYIVWPNLLSWLPQLPHPRATKSYFGSLVLVNDRPFAHGGTGILLSQAAMHEFVVVNNGTAARWNKLMHDECCGDLVLGIALKNMGIPLNQSWPTLNGEKPNTLPFGKSHWCQPIVTMHHVQPEEMNLIDQFEMSRNHVKEPLIMADIFRAMVRDLLPDSLEQWDNSCRDVTTELDSYEACYRACVEDKDCFQFNHHDKECARCHNFHLGSFKEDFNGTTYRSGWLLGRIYSWVDSQEPCINVTFPLTTERGSL